MRTADINRKTKETDIKLTLDLDGRGNTNIDTGIGFFNHMLTAFAVHAGFNLKISCNGDLDVDGHHTVEDIGIALGQAFAKCTEEKNGLTRYGSFVIPMDESLAECAVDISNRPFLVFNASFTNEKIGELDTQLIGEFFRAFATNALITLHLNSPYGENDHHKCEALFKAAAHALSEAVKVNGDKVLSSKGII